MRYLILLWFWALWAPALCRAQEAAPALPIEEAVALAVRNNPGLLAAVRDIGAAQSGLRSARALTNPDFTVAPALGNNNGTPEELLFRQPLELNGTREARSGVAKAALRVTQAEAVVALRNLVAATQNAYYDLARAQEQLALARSVLGGVQEFDRLTRRQVELGSRPGIEQTQTGIETARARQQVTLAESQVAVAAAALNALLGRSPETPIGALSPLSSPETGGENPALPGNESLRLDSVPHPGGENPRLDGAPPTVLPDGKSPSAFGVSAPPPVIKTGRTGDIKSPSGWPAASPHGRKTQSSPQLSPLSVSERGGDASAFQQTLAERGNALKRGGDASALPQPPAGRGKADAGEPARAEIAALEAARDGFRQEARLARAEGRPDLAPQFRVQQFGASDGYGFSLAVTLPLFDWGSRRNRIRQAEQSARAQEARIAAAQNQVQQEIAQARARLLAAETALREYRQGVLEQAQRLLEGSRKAFQTGAANTSVLTVLEAQRTFRSVQSEYIEALAELKQARVELERATGAVPADWLRQATETGGPRK